MSKTYTFDVKFTGYEQVMVKARNLAEAEQKALDRFDELYESKPVTDLRSKTVELQRLGIE